MIRKGERRIIAVYTENELLFQKILLDAPEDFTVVKGESLTKSDAFITLVDKDSAKAPQCEHITMSRRGGEDIKIPFALGTVKALVLKDYNDYITVSKEEKCVLFRGARIRLTDVELSLLALLLEKRGEYASREEILDAVWNNEADSGVINVYIHYLREKLELDGEKIILSSRKLGYAIDERFINKNDTGRG